MAMGGGNMHGAMLRLAMAMAMAACAAADVTDVFAPFCGAVPAEPLAQGWKRWSDPATWPNRVVPGVGEASGKDAVIPCNAGVILDVGTITLDKLIINGWLKVQDKGPFQVMANFVVVQGRLTIGTPSLPYGGAIAFNLTEGGYDYSLSQGSKMATLGRRAFAVVGGLVEMNGMYGNQRAWTFLRKSAPKGSPSLVVDGDVSLWPVNGSIAIASTDFDYKQAERRTITGVVKGKWTTTVYLDKPLDYMHWGDPIQTGVAGVTMSQSAEIALLTRSIRIQGHPNPNDPLIGGHFVVWQTPLKHKIYGVELANMGQQGTLGKYPMHMHLCQSLAGAVLSKLSIHDSNQRCIVVHGSSNLLIDGNTAFNTKGHCFMVEDGYEQNNTFSNNLGISTEAVQRTIPTTQGGPSISDNAPATFWFSILKNVINNNVAAGGADSGFWFELSDRVQGPSAQFPDASTIYPRFIPLTSFNGNVAHSYMRTGLRTYSIGYRPRVDGGVGGIGNPINAPAVDVVIKNFRVFKNAMIGMFIHETDSLIIDGAMLADNVVVGIELHQVEHCIVQNSIILGETANIGNPSGCSEYGNEYANCKPISGCQFPVDVAQARSTGAGQTKRSYPQFGILIDQSIFPSNGLTRDGHSRGPPLPQHVTNVTFGNFNNQCRVAAAITGNGKTQGMVFLASHSSKQLRFVDDSPRLYMTPRLQAILGFETAADAGPIASMYVFKDEDGTLVGGGGGYAVANTPALLPANANACTAMNGDYAYACPGTCYRSVYFGLSGLNDSPTFTVTRLQDGKSFQFVSSSRSGIFLNLLAGSPYSVTIDPPPSSLTMMYGDPEGCTGSVIVQLGLPANGQWVASGAAWKPCAGSSISPANSIQTSYICSQGRATFLKVELGGSVLTSTVFTSTAGAPSCSSLKCGILPSKSQWYFNDNGDDLGSVWSKDPSTQGWKMGYGVFGYGGTPSDTPIRTSNDMRSLTWYFKTTFGFTKLSCMKTLDFGIMINDGVVVYINGNEIYRNNLPSGPINAQTPAYGDGHDWTTPEYTPVSLDISGAKLVSGVNTVAVEVHAHVIWSWNTRFDMWLTASGAGCPTATLYRA